MLEREKEIEKKRVTAQYCMQGCYSLEMWGGPPDNAATILTGKLQAKFQFFLRWRPAT